MLCTGGSLKLFSKISVVAYKSTCWSFSQQYTNVWHCTRFQFFTHFTVILYRFCGYLLSTLILRNTTMKLHHISLNFGTVGIEQFFISLPCLYIGYTHSINTLHMFTDSFVQYFLLCFFGVAQCSNTTIIIIVVDTFVCWCHEAFIYTIILFMHSALYIFHVYRV